MAGCQSSMLVALRQHLEENGFAVVPRCRPARNCCASLTRRSTPDVPEPATYWVCLPSGSLQPQTRCGGSFEPVLGPDAFAVRGILFNKLPGANWKVPWHQDCAIAVRERRDVPGWGPWSVKDAVPHVRPPAEVLARMLAVRVHLDDCGNAGRAAPRPSGVAQARSPQGCQILGWPKEAAITCAVRRGDAILMRPLLLHASSSAAEPASRRVIHIEFAADELPDGMQWHERIRI